MRTQKTAMNQLGSDVHLLWGMLLSALFLLLAPFIFCGVLIFAVLYMSADEIWVVKVLEVVVGPFGFVIWWITITHFGERRRARRLIEARTQAGRDYSEPELRFLENVGKAHHLRTFAIFLVSFAGALYIAYRFHDAGNRQFSLIVLAGICSPAFPSLMWRVLRRAVTGAEF